MFSLHGVTLRPLEFDRVSQISHDWSTDRELEILAGWGPRWSRAAYRQHYERRIIEPENDFEMFGVVVEGRLVGNVQLALIDQTERRAAVGIVIAEKQA